MSWGGLNPALTAWRKGIVARFPHRGSQSDGGYADAAHGSSSQHQQDADGTVDAFDCDVNFLGSGDPDGNAKEDRIAEALKLDFEADPRSQLWIHQREIANRDIGPWSERAYTGDNPHDKHIHFQSRQSRETDGSAWKFTHTDALLREMEDDVPFQDEKIAVTATTGKELFEPDKAAGSEVSAAALLQLAAIWARRGAMDAAAVEARLATLEGDIAAIRAAVAPTT
jgi:hypothetical protein